MDNKKQASFWSAYKRPILVVILAFLALILLIINILALVERNRLKMGFGGGQSIEQNFSNDNRNSGFFANRKSNINNNEEANFPLVDQKKYPLRFLFFGDLMLDRHVGEKIQKYGLDYLLENLMKDDFISGYDIVSANLEGAVTSGGQHYPPNNLYDFAFSPDIINQLKKYNFNFFNLANNHFSDQGLKGENETFQNLSDLGFYYSGCRDAYLSNLSDLSEVVNVEMGQGMPVLSSDNCSSIILEVRGVKIVFLGFSIVYKEIEKNKIMEQIKKLKEVSDFVIVNVHFGTEYQTQANNYQKVLAREMIDFGADVIIGHHPHVSQNYEIYQGKPIFYSLGNFVFDQYFSAETQSGLAVGLDIKEDKSIDFSVYKIKTAGSRIEEIIKMP